MITGNFRLFRAPAIACAISAAMLCGVSAAGDAKALTGTDVLTRCQAAYGKLSSYQGTVTSSTDSKMAMAAMTNECSAHIVFARPGRIRVDGSGTDGNTFAYVCNGTTTETDAFGGWSKAESPMMAIGAVTGIGLHAATTVPSTLMEVKMGGITGIPSAVLASGNSTVNGHSCYKVVVDTPYKITYWVDKKTWLLVKTVEDLSALMSGIGPSGPFLITLNIKDPIINGHISPRVFALPKATTNEPLLNPARN